MKNRDPPKPHILKEAWSDMLVEPLIFASIFHEDYMFFHVLSGTAPGPPFLLFFRHFTGKVRFLTPPWRPAGSQMAPQISQLVPKVTNF